jgi:hypothetical protein
MKGSNIGLEYSSNMNSFKTFGYLNLIIIILSMVILLFGLFTPKFIGLEMILTLQLIFFSQFLIEDA